MNTQCDLCSSHSASFSHSFPFFYRTFFPFLNVDVPSSQFPSYHYPRKIRSVFKKIVCWFLTGESLISVAFGASPVLLCALCKEKNIRHTCVSHNIEVQKKEDFQKRFASLEDAGRKEKVRKHTRAITRDPQNTQINSEIIVAIFPRKHTRNCIRNKKWELFKVTYTPSRYIRLSCFFFSFNQRHEPRFPASRFFLLSLHSFKKTVFYRHIRLPLPFSPIPLN